MSSIFGRCLRLSLFGQSHGPAVGIVLDGFPPGMRVDMEAVCSELARRAPGRDALSSPRQETDEPEILSGVLRGVTTGDPLTCVIRNRDARPADYGDAPDLVRPGHADYTACVRSFGCCDWRGGGHLSGRLTAPLVFAGALCRQYLSGEGIRLGCHIESLAQLQDRRFADGDEALFQALHAMRLPVLEQQLAPEMEAAVLQAREAGDSVGGVLECMAVGLPAGLGSPFFDSVESQLAQLLFSIPGVKGVEFGDGFDLALRRGSEVNDAFRMQGGRVVTQSNHSGGVLGGVTNGMPLVFRVCVKPTPTISLPQNTISLRRGENAVLTAAGRHDPCIVPRAVPVVEAAAAIVLLDLLKDRAQCLHRVES